MGGDLTVADDDACALLDGFLCHGVGEIVGHEDDWGLFGARARLDVAQQQTDVVPGPLGDLFGEADQGQLRSFGDMMEQRSYCFLMVSTTSFVKPGLL